jgi:hypothetical protein
MRWAFGTGILSITLATVLSACLGGIPGVECDPPEDEQARLTCADAVNAASRALPAGTTAFIDRIQFLYGSPTPCCSRLYGAGEEAPLVGYVVFTAADGSRDYVGVSLWDGDLVTGAPMPYGQAGD